MGTVEDLSLWRLTVGDFLLDTLSNEAFEIDCTLGTVTIGTFFSDEALT